MITTDIGRLDQDSVSLDRPDEFGKILKKKGFVGNAFIGPKKHRKPKIRLDLLGTKISAKDFLDIFQKRRKTLFSGQFVVSMDPRILSLDTKLLKRRRSLKNALRRPHQCPTRRRNLGLFPLPPRQGTKQDSLPIRAPLLSRPILFRTRRILLVRPDKRHGPLFKPNSSTNPLHRALPARVLPPESLFLIPF